MSFGGAVSAMITSLKNNRRQRSSAFDKVKNYGEVHSKKPFIDKKASPQQLKEIREKLKRENRRATLITLSVVLFFLIVLLVVFKYLFA